MRSSPEGEPLGLGETVGVGVRVWVCSGVGVGVRVSAGVRLGDVGVGVGVTVGVAVGVGVGVGVGDGVGDGVGVAGNGNGAENSDVLLSADVAVAVTFGPLTVLPNDQLPDPSAAVVPSKILPWPPASEYMSTVQLAQAVPVTGFTPVMVGVEAWLFWLSEREMPFPVLSWIELPLIWL